MPRGGLPTRSRSVILGPTVLLNPRGPGPTFLHVETHAAPPPNIRHGRKTASKLEIRASTTNEREGSFCFSDCFQAKGFS